MSEITQGDAIRAGISKLGLDPATPGRAWRVRRLDRPSSTYYLVDLGGPGATVGVAIVDPVSGDIGVSTRFPGVAPYMPVEAAEAVALAGGAETARVELVWMPCRASKSPLYPLWEVQTPTGVRYVDQHRCVMSELTPAMPGG